MDVLIHRLHNAQLCQMQTRGQACAWEQLGRRIPLHSLPLMQLYCTHMYTEVLNCTSWLMAAGKQECIGEGEGWNGCCSGLNSFQGLVAAQLHICTLDRL
jgi:hypothetical protein